MCIKSYDAVWRAKVEGKPQWPRIGFSVFEAFSFLLDDGMAVWLPKNDESPHHN
ncbi:MAG: hypothetical protein QXK98_02480 [Candidatus Bathyarchaeia archaeon]